MEHYLVWIGFAIVCLPLVVMMYTAAWGMIRAEFRRK